MIETIIKISILAILLLAGLLYWLLPKSAFAQRLHMSESVFTLTSLVGLLCGAIGLVVTLVWPQYIINLHLWELILIPFVLLNVYWAIIMKIQRSAEILDEKQSFNMATAAGLTWALSIPAMVLMFILYENGIFNGSIWFPYYFFVTLLLFSGFTLYFFKKA